MRKNLRPEAWFHIIGGNVPREGLTADLEAIAGTGIGGDNSVISGVFFE